VTVLGRPLGDAASLLASWEAGARAPAAVRGAAVLATLHPGGEAVLDLPLPEVAALAAGCLVELFGDDIEGVVECDTCGRMLEVRVGLVDLFGGPPTDGRAGRRSSRFAVRSPTPRDIAAAGIDDDARIVLIRSCVTVDEGEVDPAALSPADLDEIDAAVESLAGPALPLIRATCPDCGDIAAAALDAPDLLWRHVETLAAALLRDVARLATAFGWREPDVLALSAHRRSAYLALVP
jgi:hypothetical protein